MANRSITSRFSSAARAGITLGSTGSLGSKGSDPFFQPFRHRRAGITLLEVLISIGVLAIGLLGVATLVPIATHKAVQGTLEDRKGMVGRRAFHEFRVRGLNRPDRWFFVQGGGGYQPYCIDPRMFGTNPAAPIKVFPASGDIPMVRGTLRVVQNGPPISIQQADEMFVFKDDLTFEIPDKPELPPQQATLQVDSRIVKRASEGHFSWMATLVPDPLLGSDMYVFSAVVFHQRILEPTQEVVLESSWLGGNDIRLRVNAAQNANPLQAADLFQKELRVGNWLLLAQRSLTYPGDPVPVGPYSNDPRRFRFKWVRVIAANDGDDDSQRIVTVAGPDWTWQRLASNGRPQPWDTQVTLIPGVVSVYEKTIRLERSSPWAF